MGRPLRPYKTDANSLGGVKIAASNIGYYKMDVENNTYVTADEKYKTWLNGLNNEDAVNDQAVAYVNKLAAKGGRVGELAKELSAIIGTYKNFEVLLRESLLNEHREQTLQGMHAMAEELTLGVQEHGERSGRTFSKVLYDLNQASGGAYAKDNGYKALYQMGTQLDRALMHYNEQAIDQINAAVDDRNKNLKDCLVQAGDYNLQAYQYVFNDEPNTRLGIHLEGPEDVENRFVQKMQVLNQQIDEYKSRQGEFEENLAEKRDARIVAGDKKGREEIALKEAKQAMEEAKKVLDQKEIEASERAREVREDYVSSLPTEQDVHNDEKARLVRELDEEEQKYFDYKKQVEDKETEINTTCFDYDIQISRAQYDPRTQETFFTDDEMKRVQEMESARNEVKRSRNGSSLDGDTVLPTKETNLIIEALRTGEEKYVEKLSPQAMPFYSWSVKYAKFYDLVHPDEKMVQVSGKDWFSYARDCSVGIKAAIDMLNGSIPTEKKPVCNSTSRQIRDALESLDSTMAQQIKANPYIEKYKELQKEKEKYATESRPIIAQMREELNKKKQNLEKMKEDFAKKVSEISQEDAKVYAQPVEQQKNDRLTKAEAEKADAQKNYDDAKAKAESCEKKHQETVNAYNAALDAEKEAQTAFDNFKQNYTDMCQEKAALEEEHTNLVNTAEKLKQQKKECHAKVEALYAEKVNVCQTDERSDAVLEKISNFYNHVNDGNPEKSNGKREHNDGSHYKALKESLRLLKEDLSAHKLSNEQIAGRLTELKSVAQSYLDTRARDLSVRWFGGTTFRYNRMNFATDIVNTCAYYAGYVAKEMKATNQEYEKAVKLPNSDLLPEPKFSNKDLLHSNRMDYLYLNDEPNPDAERFTEVDTDDILLGKFEVNQQREDNVEQNLENAAEINARVDEQLELRQKDEFEPKQENLSEPKQEDSFEAKSEDLFAPPENEFEDEDELENENEFENEDENDELNYTHVEDINDDLLNGRYDDSNEVNLPSI